MKIEDNQMVYNHLTLACQAVIYHVCNPLFNNIKYKVFSKNTISQAYLNLLKNTETAPPPTSTCFNLQNCVYRQYGN